MRRDAPSRQSASSLLPPKGETQRSQPDTEKINLLKSRLYNRGLSLNALPSVKRPKTNTNPLKNQFVLNPDLLASLQRPDSKASTNRPTSARTSITGYVSVGALRPSSGRKKLELASSLLARSATQPLRPATAKTNFSSLSRVQSSRLNFDASETSRVMNLIDKMTGRSKTDAELVASIQIPKRIVIDQNPEIIPNDNFPPVESKLDAFIKKVQNDEKPSIEFIYLNPKPDSHPFDLDVVSAQKVNQQKYYTMSSKGVSLFSNGSPVEFVKLND